jgi:uncharacterized LabA/DUF88 family protein
VGETQRLLALPDLANTDLFRIYYYDAPPPEGTERNPVDGSLVDFSNSPQKTQNKSLIDALELEPNFAVRRGTLVLHGWKLGKKATKALSQTARPITAKDVVPDIEQKGVDMRVGLDIAWLALKRIVDVVVLVTGDSDFVPVMKFARKEGLRVYLAHLGHGVRRELRVHADLVL